VFIQGKTTYPWWRPILRLCPILSIGHVIEWPVGKHQQTVQIGEREQSERNSMECRAAMSMTLFWRDQGKLVHRGLRHARSERGQGAAGGIGGMMPIRVVLGTQNRIWWKVKLATRGA
jgi:hypothetical protein